MWQAEDYAPDGTVANLQLPVASRRKSRAGNQRPAVSYQVPEWGK